MEAPLEDATEEIERLQRCMNDLVSLLALPAIWSGGDPPQIVRALIDVLLSILSLDFVYVRLRSAVGDAPIEMVRVHQSQKRMIAAQDVGEAFQSWMGEDLRNWPPLVQNPVGEGDVSIVPQRLGLHDEFGLIVAGSQRADFPQRVDRLLLNVAANQAAIALQEPRYRGEQNWLANELEQRVAQRTAELAAANDELKKEIAERRIAEERLRQREESFRAIVETTPECVKILARDGRVLQVNSAGVAMAGAPSANVVVGLNFYDFLAPEYRDPYREFHEKVCAGRKGFLEFEIITMQGERRHMETHAAPLRNNDGSVVQLGVTRDITERKQSEEKLRQSELNARLIVDSIPALVALMTPAGEVEHVNRQVLEYFGGTLEEIKNWGTNGSVHPDDLPHAIENFGVSLATGDPYEVEHRLRRSDGEYRWFQARGLPLKDTSGQIVRWYILLTDIDDRKRAEEALRSSEANFRKIINTLPTTAWSTRPDGYCDFLSHRWLDYAGFTAEQAEGWGWAAVIHPDDAPGLAEYWQSCLASGTPVDVEARMRRFDGVYRWFLFRANPLRDENEVVVKWFGTNIDVEDRKRAEEKLSRSEAFLAKAQRLSLTGSFSYYSATEEFTWSEELYRIYEFQPHLRVTLPLIGSRYHPEDNHVIEEVAAGIRRGDPNFDYEHRLLMPDGSIKYIRVVAQATPNKEGSGLEYFGAVQDLTQRRLAEAALDKARSELAHASRVATMGQLTASIAHEVNQPLAAIVTNSETGLRWLTRPEPNVDKALELTKRVVADARRASEVINGIRAMATGRTPVKTALSLNDIIEELIVFLGREFQSMGVSVSVDLALELPHVVGDRTQLQQVVVNLAVNAAQAMTQHGTVRRGILIGTILRDPDTVCCVVEDNGPGIDSTQIPRLFDTFFTTKDTGMGVGLPISRSIIEAHGGHIYADNDSALGGGPVQFFFAGE